MLFVRYTVRVGTMEEWVEDGRKLVGPEELEPASAASVAEALKGLGYAESGAVFKYGKEGPLPFPRHSHDTPAVELVVEGAFHYTFHDGLVCLLPGHPCRLQVQNTMFQKRSLFCARVDLVSCASTVCMVYDSIAFSSTALVG